MKAFNNFLYTASIAVFSLVSCEETKIDSNFMPPEILLPNGDDEEEDIDITLPNAGEILTYPEAISSHNQYRPIKVEYSKTNPPEIKWESPTDTRILAYLDGYLQQINDYDGYSQIVNEYGSYTQGKRFNATGRFRTEKDENGRWWIIDPDGYPYYMRGIASFRRGGNPTAFQNKYGTVERWVNKSQENFSKMGIHSMCAFGDDESYNAIDKHNQKDVQRPFPQAPSMSFLSNFRLQKGYSYPNGNANTAVGLVFYDGWDDWCKEYVKSDVFKLYLKNKYVIGFFSDNEIDFSRYFTGKSSLLLYQIMSVEDEGNPACKAAYDFMREKGVEPNKDKVTRALNDEFAGICAEKYYKAVNEAIKAVDSDMLYLGTRLHGTPKYMESVIKAAGKYCDIISINYYARWSPEREYLNNWKKWADRPFMVTEFYTKAVDDNELENTTGAGMVVRTEKDRAFAYQHFTLGLLEAKNCIGWVYFKYQDDDSNRGIYDNNYKKHSTLGKFMEDINWNVYNLVEFFDK